MIKVYFNEHGFYIEGDGIENAWSCRPAMSETGQSVFQPAHHLYGILERALRGIIQVDSKSQIWILNDSRIIDEINGIIQPLDETCKRWRDVIRQHRLPEIKAVIYFRKRSSDFISDNIARSHQNMIHSVDQSKRDRALKAHRQSLEKQRTQRQHQAVNRFKAQWFQTKALSPK